MATAVERHNRTCRKKKLSVLRISLKSNQKTKCKYNTNSAEVDIAPAFGEISTACNVGQAKKGHGACLKSEQRKFSRLDAKY